MENNYLNLPKVSIITVNFNGKKFLSNLFSSIGNLNYPKDKLNVIMVDNGSTDDSCNFVENNFSWVKIIKLQKNTGYAFGNNIGMKNAEGKYIALINNDCIVDKNWLIEMVKLAEFFENNSKGKLKVGAVCSKVLFYYKYIPVILVVSLFNSKGDKIKGSAINDIFKYDYQEENIDISLNYDKKNADKEEIRFKVNKIDIASISNIKPQENSLKFLSGCSCLEKDLNGNYKFNFENYLFLAIPIPDILSDTVVKLKLNAYVPKIKSQVFSDFYFEIKAYIKDLKNPSNLLEIKVDATFNSNNSPNHNDNNYIKNSDYSNDSTNFSSLSSGYNYEIKFVLNKENYKHTVDIINSCGLEINKSFYARDRGYECFDLGEFNEADEVFSPSGSSLLVKKELIDSVGYFDGDFFTYYEDIDLFWRARLAGWKTFYSPLSIARHYHCGTSTEWSYKFTYYVLRNRILAIFKCGWPLLFIKSYAGFVFSMIKNAIFLFMLIFKGKRLENRPDIKARLVLFFEFFYLIPKNFKKRLKIRLNRKVKDSEIKKLTVNF